MKIRLENLGALRYGEFELGKLTIICGKNNTGKTYATYALFGFLHIQRFLLKRQISKKISYKYMQTEINLEQVIPLIPEIIKEASKEYTKELPNIFSSDEKFFRDSSFVFSVDSFDFREHILNREFFNRSNDFFAVEKESGSFMVTIAFLKESGARSNLPNDYIAEVIYYIIFADVFPSSFIASAERTGAAIFYRELDFARNRLLKEISRAKEIDPFKLLLEGTQDYALPVEVNVEFTRNLENISKKTSHIAKQCPQILNTFAELIGGSYGMKKNLGVQFKPTGKSTRLSMSESSSAVRSLLDIGFYLHHLAKPGDLLMVDEPELNLHPENQRLVARLFACLVNAGVNVFVTTHSDYFIKEINTLILLNQDKSYLKKIAQEEGYPDEALISADKVKVYIAEKAKVLIPGNERKTNCQTLTKAPIEPQSGIEVRSFDDTINDMNRIEDRIIWDGDDD